MLAPVTAPDDDGDGTAADARESLLPSLSKSYCTVLAASAAAAMVTV